MTVELEGRYVTKSKDHAEGGHILTPTSIMGLGSDAWVTYSRSGTKKKGKCRAWWFEDHCINIDRVANDIRAIADKLLEAFVWAKRTK